MSRPTRRPSAGAQRLFSVLLRLYPPSLRTRFGAQMRQFFLDDYRDSVETAGTRAAPFLLRTCWRMVVGGIGARLERAPSHRATGTLEPARWIGARDRMGGLARTVLHAARGLFRSPAFALTSVLTLGLGIGACTTIFTVMHPVLIAPLPYPESNELVALYEKGPGPAGRPGWVSPLTFRDWRERTGQFDALAGWRLNILPWTGAGEPRVMSGWAVSAGYFPLMGLQMTLGRGFTEAEDRPGHNRVIVLSHSLWAQHFGSEPDVLGRSMTLDGEPHTIVGVANPGLDFPSGGDYWTPLGIDYALELRDFRYLGVAGRLRPGATTDDGRADLERISRQVALENPETNLGWGVQVTDLKEDQVGRVRPVLVGMTVAVGLLLLIALGNVTNLSVAHAVGRQTDSAVRRALGASHADLARRFIAEGLLLSVAGGILGVWVAMAGVRVMGATVLASLPRADEIAVDGWTLVFAAGTAVVVGIGLGLLALVVPAGAALSDTLRAGGAGGTGSARARRMREAVLTTQVALALSLLIGASLLTRSLLTLTSVDLGFDPQNVLAFGFDLPGAGDPDQASPASFYRDALAAVREIPGIEAAGAVTPLPMEMGSVPRPWSLPADVRPSGTTVMAHMRTATPGYLEAMAIRLVDGRAFDSRDRGDTQQVALVNEAFVQRYLGSDDPLGLRMSAGEPDADEVEWVTVVGVVEDVRFRSLTAEAEPEVYLPMQQLPAGWGHLVIRASGPREPIVRAISAAVRSVNPDLPLADVKTGSEIVGRYLTTSRLSTMISVVFATVAAALAVVGILGVLSLALAERVKEIGLRMVLGAQPGSIRRFAVGRALRPIMVGLGLGLAMSVAMSRFLESQVFGISTLDAPTYVLATLGFAAAGVLACLIPGARAAASDPLSLLRPD